MTKMEKTKDKKGEVTYRSKVGKGFRVVIPKDIVDKYKVKNGDIVEWIFDRYGNVRVEIKEIVLKDKKAKVEMVSKEQ